MATDEAIDTSRKVTEPLAFDVTLTNSTPEGSWVSRPIAESVTESMEKAPLGALYELTYAALGSRLRKLLDPNGPLSGLLTGTLVATAINFRALNPNFGTGGGRIPTVPPNSGAGSNSYASRIWGPQKDERMPMPMPLGTATPTYAIDQNPITEQNKGLLIAKLFADLQHHLPCVLFNITSKTYVPIGIGGSSVSKRFYQDGKVISELAYKAMISVEATAVTEDDESTSNLQAIIEACFGTLRDQVAFGSAVSGKSWQLMMPIKLSPSNITEVDAPWSQGDDKGAKLYTATVGLDEMMFECFTYVGKPMAPLLSRDVADAGTSGPASISLAVGDDDLSGPLRLRLGQAQRLTVTNGPVSADLAISQTKRVVELRQPYQGGVYQIIPRRTGEATLYLYDTQMTIASSESPTARVGAPLAQRKVVVSAV